jgi:hypothetical protein
MILTSVHKMPKVESAFVILGIKTKSGVRLVTTEEIRKDHRTGKQFTKMGFPGGKADKHERAWDAVRREWKEETGFNFPAISFPGALDFLRFVWKYRDGSTAGIYVGFTNDIIPIAKFKPNKEIAALHLTLVSDIKAAIDGKGDFTVRDSAKASTMAIFKALGWA